MGKKHQKSARRTQWRKKLPGRPTKSRNHCNAIYLTGPHPDSWMTCTGSAHLYPLSSSLTPLAYGPGGLENSSSEVFLFLGGGSTLPSGCLGLAFEEGFVGACLDTGSRLELWACGQAETRPENSCSKQQQDKTHRFNFTLEIIHPGSYAHFCLTSTQNCIRQ